MVGYNRRFSPLARKAREVFQRVAGPLLINYRVNAGFLPKEHWTQTEQGGGRILGEVCHFVDLMQFLTGSEPVSVYAMSVAADNAQVPDQDNVVISIRFRNGSVGPDRLSGLRRQVAQQGAHRDLRRRAELRHRRLPCRRTLRGRQPAARLKLPGKGHREEVEAFLRAVRDGQPSPIPLESLALTSAATFAILDSLRTGLPQAVSI